MGFFLEDKRQLDCMYVLSLVVARADSLGLELAEHLLHCLLVQRFQGVHELGEETRGLGSDVISRALADLFQFLLGQVAGLLGAGSGGRVVEKQAVPAGDCVWNTIQKEVLG